MSDLNVMGNVPAEVVAMVRLPMEVRVMCGLVDVLTAKGARELYMKEEPKGWLMIYEAVADPDTLKREQQTGKPDTLKREQRTEIGGLS